MPTVVGTDQISLPEGLPVGVRIDRLEAGGRMWDQVVVTESQGRDGVVIIVERDGRIAFVRQWRHALNAWVWELPRGFGESADPVQEARREAAEEIATLLTRPRLLGRFATNSGLLSGWVQAIAADYAGPAPKARDEAEIAEIRWVARDDIDGWLASQSELDGVTLAAVNLWARLGSVRRQR